MYADALPFAQGEVDRLRGSSLGSLLKGEIVVDLFAGGGGATCGIEAAGLVVHKCVNHSELAIATHAANHPATNHRCGDVWGNAPVAVAAGRPVGLLWASPDCRHFSRARGAAPVSGRVRSLAWVVVKWAKDLPERQKPRVVIVENVAEFIEWGPTRAKLDDRGGEVKDPQGRVMLEPVPERKGETFRRWVRALRREGYTVDWRVLDAAQPYVGNTLPGAACRRKRLFVIARRDGMPVCWPEGNSAARGKEEVQDGDGTQLRRDSARGVRSDDPSAGRQHNPDQRDAGNRRRTPGQGQGAVGDGASQGRLREGVGTHREGGTGWRSNDVAGLRGGVARCAADIIDWSDLGSSIFDRKKPLAEKTLARIAEGIRRYVVNDPAPFVLRVTQTGGGGGVGGSVRSVAEAMPTQTTRQDLAVATPIVTRMANGNGPGNKARGGRGATPMGEPLQTLHAGGNAFGMATPILSRCGGNGGVAGGDARPTGAGGAEGGVLAAMTMSAGGPECKAEPVDRTLGTVLTRDHRALVAALLMHNTTHHQGGRADGVLPTVTTGGQTGLVAPVLATLRQNTGPTRVDEAMNTVTASGTHAGLVAALMVKFYGNESGAHRPDAAMGTVTTKDRHGLVCVLIDGAEYVIVDILFRMLKPSELADAMGFPVGYIWPKTQRECVKLIGNAVSPPMAEALVRSQFPNGMLGRKEGVA
jgi:DNA (cytosine-5)-methyltransferase 1